MFRPRLCSFFVLFFFNDTATTEIYTLSLHDALPISSRATGQNPAGYFMLPTASSTALRSEEHTSELQSHHDLVCRLLLDKKKKNDPDQAQAKRHQRGDEQPTQK